MLSYHLHNTRKLAGVCLYATLVLVFIAASIQSRSAHAISSPAKTNPVTSPTPKVPKITFDPSAPSTTAGNTVTITAKVFDAKGDQITDTSKGEWDWKIADPDLAEFLLITENDKKSNQRTVAGLFGAPKSGSIRPNLIPIIVTYTETGKTDARGVVNVRLNDSALPAGPIPPGINAQVDIMWAVMPQNIVRDNFGNKIKKQYYGIEVVIGNDSGYDLELASVGFNLGRGDLETAAGLPSNKIPTSGYRVTRASLQRRQQLNLRNLTLNIIKSLGPVLTGFTPFFHNVNHTNNYVEGINILSGPIQQGFEFVWPDLTIGQLANLEDQSLRDNSITRTVVKNNTQVRFVVFVPKDLINNEKLEDHRKWRDQPLEVMKKLGSMILVGDQVEHINRVRVVSSAETGAAFSISGRIFDPCLKGVEGATVTLDQPDGTKLTAPTDSEGRYHFDKVASGLSYTLTPSKPDTTFKTPTGNSFTLHGNRTNIDFFTQPSPITISGTITKAETDEKLPAGITVELTSESATPKFELRIAEPDEDGSYEFPDVPGGFTYKVTPKLEGRTFTPEPPATVPSSNCDGKEYDFELEPK